MKYLPSKSRMNGLLSALVVLRTSTAFLRNDSIVVSKKGSDHLLTKTPGKAKAHLGVL